MEGSEHTAAALIRAWLEPDDGVVLKVRVVGVSTSGEFATIGTATDVDGTCEIVRAWLRELFERASNGQDSGPSA